MNHWKLEDDFDNQSDLDTQAMHAIQDYSTLIDIRKKFDGLTTRAVMMANTLNNKDVQHDINMALD